MKLNNSSPCYYDDPFGQTKNYATREKTENLTSESTDEKISFGLNLLNAIPIEGIAFLAASLAVRIFSISLSTPLLGIGISILTTRIALKALDCYDDSLLVELTKEACKFNKRFPKLQIITFIFALALSFYTKTLSFITGACLGSFGSIILDVENYKFLQEANRKRS